MLIREAAADDWPRIWPLWHRIVAAGEAYTWDPGSSEEAARALWTAPGKHVYVAEDAAGAVVGSAYVTPDYGGPAARVAGAGFMVDPDPDPDRAGLGTGRALAAHILAAARADGYRGMVFNAVVETDPAVKPWTALGFTILATVPTPTSTPGTGGWDCTSCTRRCEVPAHPGGCHRAPQSSGAVRRHGRSSSN